MLKQYSYKQKLKMLVIAAVILLLLCYRFSVSRTIAEKRAYKEQKQAAGLQEGNVVSLQLLESKNRMLNKMLEQFVLDTLDESKNLLGIVSNYCNEHELDLKEYKPNPVNQADSLKILTRNITVEGSFRDCLQLVYNLETKYKAGRVSSVIYKSFEDPSTAKTYLNCTIYVQNIISSPYEKL